MARGNIRISHNYPSKDFAPGVLNVVERSNLTNVNYYKIETFHSSPFYNETVPVLIHDINHSLDLMSIYGNDCLRLERKGTIVINNHPIRSVRLLANIVDYQEKTLNGVDFYIFTLDDYSESYSKAKIRTTEIYSCDFRDKFVHIIGKVGRFKEIDIESFRIVSLENYHQEMFLFWEQVFEFKKILEIPWYQTPQINNSHVVIQNANQLKARRMDMDRINMNQNCDEDEDDNGFSQEFFIVDSQIYTKPKALQNSFQESNVDQWSTHSGGLDEDCEILSVANGKRTRRESNQDDEELTDITVHLFKSIPIFKPLSPIEVSGNSWYSVTQKPISPPLTPDQDLILTIFKWAIRHLQNNISTDELLNNTNISNKLKISINSGVIDLEDEVKSISELRIEKIHSILQSLDPLIEDSFDAENLILLFQELEKHLRSLRFKRVKLLTQKFFDYYNKSVVKSRSYMSMDLTILNHLIYWYFGKENDRDFWCFNDELEWAFINEKAKQKRVLKVRK